jgi:D-hexose-6-phosphate mutarotase
MKFASNKMAVQLQLTINDQRLSRLIELMQGQENKTSIWNNYSASATTTEVVLSKSTF